MLKLVICALFAMASARPNIGVQFQQYGGQGFSGSGFSSGSSGGSFGGGSGGGLIRGESQIIDISPGGAPSNVVYKPIYKPGPVQVNTHFFIHESPDEALTPEERQKQIEARTHKHYKIIFIKAPSAAGVFAGGSAAVGVQNEEKTLIYVLSKKPEGATGEEVEFPAPPAPIYSDPEVFFVKYTTQEEAQNAIAKLQETLNQEGTVITDAAQIASALGQITEADTRSESTIEESHKEILKTLSNQNDSGLTVDSGYSGRISIPAQQQDHHEHTDHSEHTGIIEEVDQIDHAGHADHTSHIEQIGDIDHIDHTHQFDHQYNENLDQYN